MLRVYGFDTSARDLLDDLSIACAISDLRDDGRWVVEEDSGPSSPWDLTAELEGVARRIRVIGTTLHEPKIALLPWEYEAASQVPHWELAIVIWCLSGQKAH